jgi:dUTPase
MTLYIYASTDHVRSLIETQIQNHRWTDSGFDIPMPFQSVNLDNYSHSFALGIHVTAVNCCNIPLPCILLPRSSIYKTEFRLANSIGLIDAGYRGEVQAKVDILHIPEKRNNDDHVFVGITSGTRMFQICQHNFLPWNKVILVDTLESLPAATDNRGSGGFGSTTLEVENHGRT